MRLNINAVNAKNTSNLLDDRRSSRLDAVRVEDGGNVVRRQGVQVDRVAMIAAKRVHRVEVVALHNQTSVRHERRPRHALTTSYGDLCQGVFDVTPERDSLGASCTVDRDIKD